MARTNMNIPDDVDREMRHEAVDLGLRYPGEFVQHLWKIYKKYKEVEKMGNDMTAREFLEWAGWEGDFEEGLAILGQYVGKESQHFIHCPDAYVRDEDGYPLATQADEPANFQEYADSAADSDDKFARKLGFGSYSELCEKSEVVYEEPGDVTWFVTELPDGRWAAWDDVEISPHRAMYFDSRNEAVEFQQSGIEIVEGE